MEETAAVRVDVNGQEAEDKMRELIDLTKHWKKELEAAMRTKDPKAIKEAEKNLKLATKATKELEKQMFDVNKVLNNLSGASLHDLKKAQKELNRELSSPAIKRNSKEWKELTGKLRRVKGELGKVRKEMKGATSTGNMWAKGLTQIKMLLPALGIATAISLITRFGKELYGLAIQLEGDNRRANIVFGDSMAYVEKEAENLSKAMGLTNKEFVAAAANTADLLIPLDFTREASAKMSVELQSMAGALDEWTGGRFGAAHVSNVLTKAMLGENEQLKTLGIAIRKDTDEFRDLVKEKLRTTDATKVQAEAMATLELIQKKSADAQTAYTQDGNKLLRIQKSLSRGWRQMKENIVLFVTEGLKSASTVFNEHAKTVKNLEDNITPLITEYENLTTKTNLSEIEQRKLNSIIETIGSTLPGAITQFDEYGKVIGISADKAKDLIKQQKAMLLIKNKEAIKESEDALDIVNRKYESLVRIVEYGKETITVVNSMLGTSETYTVDLNTESIEEYRIEIEKLGQQKLGLEGLIKVLKGEPLINPENIDIPEKIIQTIKSLKEKLDDLKKAKEEIDVTDEKALIQNEKQIQSLDKLIKKYENLGKVINEKPEKPDKLETISPTNYTDVELDVLDTKLTAMEEREEAYSSAVKNIHKGLSEEKLNAIENYAGAAMQFTDSLMMFNEAAMNRELEAAGDNEVQKEAIRKKYAKKQQTMSIIQSIIQGALGIVKTGANLGYPLAIPFQILQGIETLAQIAIIKSQQFATGRYPITARDGNTYNARMYGKPTTTEIVRGPALMSEIEDEMIIDGPTTRNLVFNYPDIIEGIKQLSMGMTPQFAEGRYPKTPTDVAPVTETFTDPELLAMMTEIRDWIKNPLEAYLIANEDYIREHNKIKDEYDRVNKS